MIEKLDSQKEEMLALVSGGRLTREASAWVDRNMYTLLQQKPKMAQTLARDLMQMDNTDVVLSLDAVKSFLRSSGYKLDDLR